MDVSSGSSSTADAEPDGAVARSTVVPAIWRQPKLRIVDALLALSLHCSFVLVPAARLVDGHVIASLFVAHTPVDVGGARPVAGDSVRAASNASEHLNVPRRFSHVVPAGQVDGSEHSFASSQSPKLLRVKPVGQAVHMNLSLFTEAFTATHSVGGRHGSFEVPHGLMHSSVCSEYTM